MRSFTVAFAVVLIVRASLSHAWSGRGLRRDAPQVLDGQTGTPIAFPPLPTETGLKQIPDADAHPFVAPGPDDQRGPCPGMNTLANHGYIPRNGVATFEEIVNGMMEAFNTDRAFGGFLVAANMMMRGNPFINKVSIGGISPLVPGLPDGIGSEMPGGIALHGGFEGDASMTRADVHIGDNRNFQDLLYDKMLLELGKFGDDGPDGESTVFNLATMSAIKKPTLETSLDENSEFAVPIRRFNAMFTEASFVLGLFANGTTNQATLPIVGSFFRNQTFPQNWFRAAVPTSGGHDALAIFTGMQDGFTIQPGKMVDGVYVNDPPKPVPFNASLGCGIYHDLMSQMPAGLANTTGVFLDNVKFLSEVIKESTATAACNVTLLPFGPNFN